MTKEHFRKIYRLFPGKLCELLMSMENAVIYVFYGVLTTLVNYIVHFGLRVIFAPIPDGAGIAEIIAAMDNSAVSPTLAAAVSWVAAVLFSFFTNKYFVFENKQKEGTGRELAVFAGGRLMSLLLEMVIMFIFAEKLHFNEFAVKLGAGVIVLIINYFISKLLVFRRER